MKNKTQKIEEGLVWVSSSALSPLWIKRYWEIRYKYRRDGVLKPTKGRFACLRGKHSEKFNLNLCPHSMTSHKCPSQDSPGAGSNGGVLRSSGQGDSVMWTLRPLPGDRGGVLTCTWPSTLTAAEGAASERPLDCSARQSNQRSLGRWERMQMKEVSRGSPGLSLPTLVGGASPTILPLSMY